MTATPNEKTKTPKRPFNPLQRNLFYLLPCFWAPLHLLSVDFVDNTRKGSQGPVQQDARPSGCHQHPLLLLYFSWWMLCMTLCHNPWGSSLTGPETLRDSWTNRHPRGSLFFLWQHVIESFDMIKRFTKRWQRLTLRRAACLLSCSWFHVIL